jgi:deoxycytidine triphosphate deaminase
MLLSGNQIEEHVKQNHIFVQETFEPKNLRGAGYDLRIDPAVVIKTGGSRLEHRKCVGKFALEPGEIAILSSAERFCLQWHIAANLSVKFSSVRDGLHVLHGGLIDPGFGLRWNAIWEDWEPADDERVVFLVTNISDRALQIDPVSDSIMRVQFFELAQPKAKPGKKDENLRAQDYRKAVMAGQVDGLGLQFFQDSRVWERQLDQLRARMSESIVLVLFVLGVAALGAVAAVFVALMANPDLRDAAAAPDGTLIGIGIGLVVTLYLVLAVALRGLLPTAVARLKR